MSKPYPKFYDTFLKTVQEEMDRQLEAHTNDKRISFNTDFELGMHDVRLCSHDYHQIIELLARVYPQIKIEKSLTPEERQSLETLKKHLKMQWDRMSATDIIYSQYTQFKLSSHEAKFDGTTIDNIYCKVLCLKDSFFRTVNDGGDWMEQNLIINQQTGEFKLEDAISLTVRSSKEVMLLLEALTRDLAGHFYSTQISILLEEIESNFGNPFVSLTYIAPFTDFKMRAIFSVEESYSHPSERKPFSLSEIKRRDEPSDGDLNLNQTSTYIIPSYCDMYNEKALAINKEPEHLEKNCPLNNKKEVLESN